MQSATTNITTGFTISFDLLEGWLRILKNKTGNSDVENALNTVHFVSLTDEERDIVGTIRSLYIAEMNGNLVPSPSIRERFVEL